MYKNMISFNYPAIRSDNPAGQHLSDIRPDSRILNFSKSQISGIRPTHYPVFPYSKPNKQHNSKKRQASYSVIGFAGGLRPLYRNRNCGIQLGVAFETFHASLTYLRGMTDIVSTFKPSRLHPSSCERSKPIDEEERM